MAIRTLDSIINDVIVELRRRQPDADSKVGTVIRDLIDSLCVPIRHVYDDIDAAAIAQSIQRASGSTLDRLASNFGIQRRAGTPANVTLIVTFANIPTNGSITITDGTRVNTANNIDFTIIGTYQLTYSERAAYEAILGQNASALNSAGIALDKYAFTPIYAEAVTLGESGNVASGTITKHSITGISNVVNLAPASGGINSESDADFRERIKYVITGNNVGTRDGLAGIALQSPLVRGVKVYGPDDEGSTTKIWENI